MEWNSSLFSTPSFYRKIMCLLCSAPVLPTRATIMPPNSVQTRFSQVTCCNIQYPVKIFFFDLLVLFSLARAADGVSCTSVCILGP